MCKRSRATFCPTHRTGSTPNFFRQMLHVQTSEQRGHCTRARRDTRRKPFAFVYACLARAFAYLEDVIRLARGAVLIEVDAGDVSAPLLDGVEAIVVLDFEAGSTELEAASYRRLTHDCGGQVQRGVPFVGQLPASSSCDIIRRQRQLTGAANLLGSAQSPMLMAQGSLARQSRLPHLSILLWDLLAHGRDPAARRRPYRAAASVGTAGREGNGWPLLGGRLLLAALSDGRLGDRRRVGQVGQVIFIIVLGAAVQDARRAGFCSWRRGEVRPSSRWRIHLVVAVLCTRVIRAVVGLLHINVACGNGLNGRESIRRR